MKRKKIVNELFSFSSYAVNENTKKLEPKIDMKNVDVNVKKISVDSSFESSELDNSSDLSCEVENI